MKKAFTRLAVLGLAVTMLSSVNVFAAVGKIVDGKTYVPVRGVFEELGFGVTYDNERSVAEIRNDTYFIQVPKGLKYFVVNNQVNKTGAGIIINDSMYLPLRALGDSINATTEWNGEKKTATITYNGKSVVVYCGNIPTNAESSVHAVQPTTADNTIISEPKFDFYITKDNSNWYYLTWNGENKTDKVIKSYTIKYTVYDKNGKADANQRTYLGKGPVPPHSNLSLSRSKMGIFSDCSKVVIDTIDLTFDDNSTKTVYYGYSTTTVR